MDYNTLPTFDMEHACAQMGCKPERSRGLLAKLIPLALNDIPPKMTQLLAAMDSGDLHEAGVAAHSLKGSVSHLGAPAMFEALKTTEAACREGRREEAEEAIGWAYGHWPALEAELRACLKGLDAA